MSKRQLASTASSVAVLVSGLPSWDICSSKQPSGRLRLTAVLLSPEDRLKLRSAAAPLIISCRPFHPSPKLSNS